MAAKDVLIAIRHDDLESFLEIVPKEHQPRIVVLDDEALLEFNAVDGVRVYAIGPKGEFRYAQGQSTSVQEAIKVAREHR